MQIFIERLHFIRDAQHVCPHIIKGIGDIRKQDRLFAVEKCQKQHCKHIIRADTDKDLAAL